MTIKKMKITKIEHQKKITCFNAIGPDGQATYHIIWRTPKNINELKALKPGDTIVTDTIATIV